MSDDNDNPYQPPGPSDKPLSRKDADGPKTRLNPVHRLVPIFGYAYVPAIFIFGYLPRYTLSLGQFGIAEKPHNQVWLIALIILVALIIIATLIYVFILIRLERRRNEQGTNTRAIKLYSDLSWILPLLLVFLLRFF